MTAEDIIEELVSVILMQEEEIKALNNKLNRVKRYIEVYEEYLEGIDR